MKTGLLLINLGTPDSPSKADVRSYLRVFLSDPRVIDLPFLGRWLLLNLIILPFRPRRSAKAYKSIWTEEGSPLKVEGMKLASELNQFLEQDQVPVVLAMRYGNPSIDKGLKELKNLFKVAKHEAPAGHSGYIWATPPFLCGAAGGPRAPVGGLLGPGAACPGENSPPFL